MPRGCNWGAPYFNFRPSARGDLIVVIVLALLVLFQFPSLREGRHARRIRRSVKDGISISAPPRGATVHHLRKDTGNNISIPAPPRGATLPVEEQPPGNHISIPAPPRGATVRRSPRDARSAHFNSRPSARGDGRFCSISPHLKISIHAPPRGATANSCTVPCSVLFQFSPLREGRRVRGIDGFLRGLFQFSPLREGRQHGQRLGLYFTYFNSRPSARGDLSIRYLFLSGFYFNSRPSARGDRKRYAISANLLFNPYKSAWLNHSDTQFVEIILVIFHRIIA